MPQTPTEKANKKALNKYNKIEMMQPKTAEFPEPRKVTLSADKRKEYQEKGYKYIGKKDVNVKLSGTKKTKATVKTKDAKQVVIGEIKLLIKSILSEFRYDKRTKTSYGDGWWRSPTGKWIKLGKSEWHSTWANNYVKEHPHEINKSDLEQSSSYALIKKGWIRVSTDDIKAFTIEYYGKDKLKKVEDIILDNIEKVKSKNIVLEDASNWSNISFDYDVFLENEFDLIKTISYSKRYHGAVK